MPFFSIITINLNNAIGLKKTIESVVSQTFTDVEYIVIDGDSTDASIETIKNFEKKISYWISEKDNGIYNAMNKGVRKATGKYLLFLNSGDMLADKEVLQRVAETKPAADLVYGNMLILESNGKIREGVMPEILNQMHLLRDTLWHPVTFISRKVFADNGYYDEQFKIAGDYEFFLNLILKRRSSYKHLPITISIFDNNGISASAANKKLLADERLRAQKRYFNPLLLGLFRLYSHIRS
jgi:glycosyltransferase involved in cell wall biosynthesis